MSELLKDGAYFRIYSEDENQESGLYNHGLELLCNFCSHEKEDDGYIVDYWEPVNHKDSCEKCGCAVLTHGNLVVDIESFQKTIYGNCCTNCD